MNFATPASGTPARVQGLDAARLMARALEAPQTPFAAVDVPSVESLHGQLESFEILSFIGRGGMGAVYRARQLSLDREVAIKILPQEMSADADFAARFKNEARLLAKLQHPNIVTVHDYGETADGHLYLVMELVEGHDLAHLIKQGLLSPDRCLEIMARVCDALAYGHQRGIIHRDIKPSNILVSKDDVVKVADFGLAKLHESLGTDSPAATLTGTVMGTPDYMAPEQRNGGLVDQRADIYSLGVLFYEMLTGQMPRGVWEPASKHTGMDNRVDTVVNKALQHAPEKRYQQADEVREEVEGIQTASSRLKILPWHGLVLLALATLSGIAMFFWQENQAKSIQASQPAYRLALLEKLDLPALSQNGLWYWEDGKVGSTLVLSDRPANGEAAILGLGIAGEGKAFQLNFMLQLDHTGADAGVILPVGNSQTGLLLNLQNCSGLGLVHGRTWQMNETSTRQPLPTGRWFDVSLTVRPAGDEVSVLVMVEGAPLLQWHGAQTELTLYREMPLGWPLFGDHNFGLASYSGGIAYKDVHLRWLD
jgi:serine/threonine protein kinase